MLRSRAEQLLVGLHGVIILLQLELDVAFGGVDIRALLAALDGRVELAQSFLALTFQMQATRLAPETTIPAVRWRYPIAASVFFFPLMVASSRL